MNLPDLPPPIVTEPAGSHYGYERPWEEWEPDDWVLDQAAEYESRIVEEGIQEQVEARAKAYLAETGDAVRDRVDRSLRDAGSLLNTHPGAALACAMTAVEITVKYLILRPMLAGLVIEPTLADDLAELAISGRSERDQRMIARLCFAWKLDLGGVKTARGSPAWATYHRLKEPRNMYVHRAEPVDPDTAADAIAVAHALVDGLVEPLAHRLHLYAGTWGDEVETRDPLARRMVESP